MLTIDYAGLALTCALSLVPYLVWLYVWLPSTLRLSELLLAAFICNIAQIIGLQVGLGLFYMLTAPWLALSALLTTGVMLVIAAKRGRVASLRLRYDQVRAAFIEMRKSVSGLAILSLLILWLIWKVFLASIFPPFAYDEFYYHMPIVASVIQEHSIFPPASSNLYLRAYPRYSELLSVWNSIFLHRDTYADLALITFWIAGGLAIYSLARRANVSRQWALLCATLWWFCPTIMIQATSTYNDVMLGGLWAISLAFLIPEGDKTVDVRLCLAALASGLMLGTKISGQVHLAVVLLLLVVLHYMQYRQLSRVIKTLSAFTMIALVSGGIWHVVNAVNTGNPFYPVPISLGGYTLWPGDDFTINTVILGNAENAVANIPTLPLRLLYTWFDSGSSFGIGASLAGFGPLLPIIGLPAILIYLLAKMGKTKVIDTSKTTADQNHTGLLLLGSGLLVLTLIPASWNPRYGLAFLIVGGYCLACLESFLLPGIRRIIAAVIVSLAMISAFLSLDHVYFDVARIRQFAALPDSERIATRWDPGSFGESYQWIDKITRDKSATIAYEGSPMLYPLWGYGFRNRVIYQRPRDRQSYFDDLKMVGVDYLFIDKRWKLTQQLRSDLRAMLVFESTDDFVIFKIPQP